MRDGSTSNELYAKRVYIHLQSIMYKFTLMSMKLVPKCVSLNFIFKRT